METPREQTVLAVVGTLPILVAAGLSIRRLATQIYRQDRFRIPALFARVRKRHR